MARRGALSALAVLLLLTCGNHAFAMAPFAMLSRSVQGAAHGPLIRASEEARPQAAVHAEPDQGPAEHETAAELLRFVTAYATGLEAIVDITPYAPLLESAEDSDGNLNFYAFIDTWVGNSTGSDVLYMDNVTGQCVTKKQFDGNGWALSLDLVLWTPQENVPDVRPRSTVTLGSGYFGARYPFGVISTHEGRLDNSGENVKLDEEADLSDAASPPTVYSCPEGLSEISRAALVGYAAEAAKRIVGRSSENQDKMKREGKSLYEEMQERLITMEELEVIESFQASHTVRASFDPDKVEAYIGMPVYYQGGVFTTQLLGKDAEGNDRWWNLSYPFEPVGHVLHIDGHTMVLQLYRPCMPSEATKNLPKLVAPSGEAELENAQALIGGALKFGAKAAETPTTSLAQLTARRSTVRRQMPAQHRGSDKAGREEAPPKSEPLLLRPVDPSATPSPAPPHSELQDPDRWTSLKAVPDLEQMRPLGRIELPKRTAKSKSEAQPVEGGGENETKSRKAVAVGEGAMFAAHGGSTTSKDTTSVQQSGKTTGKDATSVQQSGKTTGKDAVAAEQSDSTTSEDAVAPEQSDSTTSEEDRICVVQRRRQGLLFTRRFRLPTFEEGERAVLQLAVTGHGWAATLEQCGEYCHAVYHLSLNDHIVANVTQFRDDCKDNPIDGATQRGTWDESRNGWCPGTVEPGIFIDVTDSAKAGRNDLEFKVVVWSNHTGHYQPYTDYYGYALADQASLTVGLTLQVYGVEAVQAAEALPWARTAAEAALRDGCSAPERLLAGPKAQWDPPKATALLQRRLRLATPQGFDFEGRAPWYLYNTTQEGAPGANAHAASVRIFDAALVQSNTRVVKASIPKALLPAIWGQAALHLQLTKPPGLQFDHWDRQASVGLFFRDEDAPGVQVQLERERPKQRQYRFER